MPPKPTFDTIGDEPIEARIVAWVLGDASAFEETELERLCEERPELLVFRRRMRALHGLLTEAEAAATDHSTKLSPAKRRVLDEIFGVESAGKRLDKPPQARVRRRWPQRLLAIAACVALLAVLGWAAFFALRGIGESSHSMAAANDRQAADSHNSEVAIQELKKAVQKQEDIVEERRKVLANIVRSKGIIYRGPGMDDSDGDNGAKASLDTFNQLETEKQQLEGHIQSLLKYSGDQLMTYASGLQLPDNVVPSLYPKYLEEKTKLQQLKLQGMGDQHPTVQAHQQIAESMKKQLDEGVVSLRDTLQSKLELADARFKRAQVSKDEKRGEAVKRGLDAQDYVDAKQEFESEQAMLQQMKLKLIGEEISSKMPSASIAVNDKKSRVAGFHGMDDRESKTVPLKIDYPSELLEGTPGPPIVLNRPVTPAAPATTAPAAPPPAAKPAASTLALRRAAKPGESKPGGGESAKPQPAADLAAHAKRSLEESTREKVANEDGDDQVAQFSNVNPLSPHPRLGAALGAGVASGKPSPGTTTQANQVATATARSAYTMPNQTDHFGALPPLPSNGTVAGNMDGSGSGHGFGAVPPALPALPSVGRGYGVGHGSGAGSVTSPSSSMQPQHLAGSFGGGGAGAVGDEAASEMPASGPVAGEPSGAAAPTDPFAPSPSGAGSSADPFQSPAENGESSNKLLADSRSESDGLLTDSGKGGLRSDLRDLAQADPFAPTDERTKALSLGESSKETPRPESAHKPTASESVMDRSESSARLAGAKPQSPAKSRSDASQLADAPTAAPADVPKTEQGFNLGLESMALRPFQAPGKDEPEATAPSAIAGGKWFAGEEVDLDKPAGERGIRGEDDGRKGDKYQFADRLFDRDSIHGQQDQNGSLSTEDLRSGNGTISKKSVDAMLDDKRALGRSDAGYFGYSQDAAGGQDSGIPTSQKNPLIGALLGDKDEARQGQADGGPSLEKLPAPRGSILDREGARQGQAEHQGEAFDANTTDAYLWAARVKQLSHDGLNDDGSVVPKDALAADLDKAGVKKESSDEAIRTSPALTWEHNKSGGDSRRGLDLLDPGKVDEAKRESEKVLRNESSNPTARRGPEGSASAESDFYRAGHDKTGAELLAGGDRSGKLPTPAGAPAKAPESKATPYSVRDFDAKAKVEAPAEPVPAGPAAATTPSSHESAGEAAEVAKRFSEEKEVALAGKNTYAGDTAVNAGTLVTGGTLELNEDLLENQAADGKQSGQLADLAQREMSRRQNAVVGSDRYVVEARDASAKGSYQVAYDNYAKALDLLPDAPLLKVRREFLRKALGDASVALANDAIKNGRNDEARGWLGKAVEWDPTNEAARQKAVADVASEITAADAPYSTFSLSISDASFKMAQAALARGERPEPSSIKIEQFYNAVDYGDPAPGPGEAVSGWVEQAAHPVIPGRNLVRVAMRTGAAGRSAAQPLRLTLLVDQSGSMARDDRRAAMTIALKQLAGLLTKNDLVTVIGFSRTPRLLADGLTGDQGEILKEVVNQAAIEGGTNLEEAMKLGEQMALRHLTAGAQNRIVLFTDGAANLGDADPSRLADKVTAMRQKGLAFDIAGIGTSNLNDLLLAELARHGNGRYCVVGAEKDAGGSFARQLAGAFRPAAENVKVQVRFNPQRVGRYKLLGFEEHRLKTEDFHNDAVDAAELAAEEAGVALYQVEPLADGNGEIGEASVRFRDAASGRMVERSWTIPYEANALAFDRAAPSLQLAGLAMLAAEKLRGGPLAEAIDFKQLAIPRATVKQYYSNSRRVAEMLEVVDKL